MRNGQIIFDLVVHIHNLLNENFDTKTGRIVQPWKYDHIKMLKEGVEPMPTPEKLFGTPPNPRDVYDRIFGGGSQIDFAMVQAVPLFDLFRETPEKNIERVYELVQLDPDRLLFCGATDPRVRGVDAAVRDIEFQIKELGAKSIKLYTAHPFGKAWRMDDRFTAYPLLECMLANGVNLVQVHKGDPQGMESLDDLHPRDLHQAALDFPDMNFIVHHLAFPFEDAAIDLGARHPNIYLAMSTWINMIQTAPIETAMRMGKLLRWCRPEKVLWGSESPIWPRAQRLLDLSWDFQIPDDLQRGWGFPEITDDDRQLMFGGNILRLLKMEERALAMVEARNECEEVTP
jgi:uncharacterized protein